MDRATEGMPAGAADAAQNSLGGASVVAERRRRRRRPALSRAAATAFVSAMSDALMVGAAVALAGAGWRSR